MNQLAVPRPDIDQEPAVNESPTSNVFAYGVFCRGFCSKLFGASARTEF